jgi:hypothetical protein
VVGAGGKNGFYFHRGSLRTGSENGGGENGFLIVSSLI